MGKVFRNILSEPTEGKYRRLRLGNKRIQEAIVDVDGGVELLQVSIAVSLLLDCAAVLAFEH
jgi:hypothetical protein